MPKYLLDTNICIYIAKERPPKVLTKFKTLAEGDVAMSVITLGELEFGACKSQYVKQSKAALAMLVRAVPILLLDENTSKHYGEIRAQLQLAGTPIGNNDLWITAHARAAGLILVTNNTREFSRVTDLNVENWA